MFIYRIQIIYFIEKVYSSIQKKNLKCENTEIVKKPERQIVSGKIKEKERIFQL